MARSNTYAVRRCWASLWNERAIAYRSRQHIDPSTVKLAVVVQRMAQAEAAGVLFTANPVTGARDEIHIAANPGLGEAVVSGLVTPDHQGPDEECETDEIVILIRISGGLLADVSWRLLFAGHAVTLFNRGRRPKSRRERRGRCGGTQRLTEDLLDVSLAHVVALESLQQPNSRSFAGVS